MASPQPVRLSLPAEPGSVRIARLVAAGVATDAGLSIDDAEDLRIAVSELVALLIEGTDDPTCTAEITYRRSPGQVEVGGEINLASSGPPGASAGAEAPTDDLALEILRVVVDEHGFEANGDLRRFHLVKRARTPT
jgi:anti-sigma regulatory factor (Ser/Thr protein kinase)